MPANDKNMSCVWTSLKNHGDCEGNISVIKMLINNYTAVNSEFIIILHLYDFNPLVSFVSSP